MGTLSDIEIEQLALNAWPGLKTYLHGGWVARWADGYTKRANSATVLFDATPADNKIEWVEAFYRSRSQRPIFRLLSFNQPSLLDERLASAGYQQLDLTQVMTLDLTQQLDAPVSHAQCQILPIEEWLVIFHELDRSKLGADDRRLHHALIKQAAGQLCPMALFVDGQPAACGLGVLDAGAIGLFDIVTAENFRRRGLGGALVNSLLAYADEKGCHTGYLQVVTKNTAAHRLYVKIGFKNRYQYWYRALAR